MAAINDLTIQNKGNSDKTFFFRGVSPLRWRRAQPSIDVPFIGTAPENTFLFRFMGQSETVGYTFVLFDDGVDVANGTHSSTVKTIDEQIAYIKDEVYTAGYDHYWLIYSGRYYPVAINCVIEDISLENAAGGASIVTGTIMIKIGRVGAL